MPHIIEIPLSEQFGEPSGRWLNYDGYTPNERALIQGQKHRDIRSFFVAENLPLTMVDISNMDMTTLNGFTMNQLNTATTVFRSENWVGSGPIVVSAHNYTSELLMVGAGTASSVMSTLR